MITKDDVSPSVQLLVLVVDDVVYVTHHHHHHFYRVVVAVVVLVLALVLLVKVMGTDLLDDEKVSSIDQYHLMDFRELVFVLNSHVHEIE